MTFTKKDIVAIVSDKTGVPKATVSLIFDEIINYIKDMVKIGDIIAIRGFGKFEKREKIIKEIKVPSIKEPLKNVKSIKCKFTTFKTFFK